MGSCLSRDDPRKSDKIVRIDRPHSETVCGSPEEHDMSRLNMSEALRSMAPFDPDKEVLTAVLRRFDDLARIMEVKDILFMKEAFGRLLPSDFPNMRLSLPYNLGTNDDWHGFCFWMIESIHPWTERIRQEKKLNDLTQENRTVYEFMKEIEYIAARAFVHDNQAEMRANEVKDAFLRGIKPEFRKEMWEYGDDGIEELCARALSLEEREKSAGAAFVAVITGRKTAQKRPINSDPPAAINQGRSVSQSSSLFSLKTDVVSQSSRGRSRAGSAANKQHIPLNPDSAINPVPAVPLYPSLSPLNATASSQSTRGSSIARSRKPVTIEAIRKRQTRESESQEDTESRLSKNAGRMKIARKSAPRALKDEMKDRHRKEVEESRERESSPKRKQRVEGERRRAEESRAAFTQQQTDKRNDTEKERIAHSRKEAPKEDTQARKKRDQEKHAATRKAERQKREMEAEEDRRRRRLSREDREEEVLIECDEEWYQMMVRDRVRFEAVGEISDKAVLARKKIDDSPDDVTEEYIQILVNECGKLNREAADGYEAIERVFQGEEEILNIKSNQNKPLLLNEAKWNQRLEGRIDGFRTEEEIRAWWRATGQEIKESHEAEKKRRRKHKWEETEEEHYQRMVDHRSRVEANEANREKYRIICDKIHDLEVEITNEELQDLIQERNRCHAEATAGYLSLKRDRESGDEVIRRRRARGGAILSETPLDQRIKGYRNAQEIYKWWRLKRLRIEEELIQYYGELPVWARADTRHINTWKF